MKCFLQELKKAKLNFATRYSGADPATPGCAKQCAVVHDQLYHFYWKRLHGIPLRNFEEMDAEARKKRKSLEEVELEFPAFKDQLKRTTRSVINNPVKINLK